MGSDLVILNLHQEIEIGVGLILHLVGGLTRNLRLGLLVQRGFRFQQIGLQRLLADRQRQLELGPTHVHQLVFTGVGVRPLHERLSVTKDGKRLPGAAALRIKSCAECHVIRYVRCWVMLRRARSY